MELCRWAHDTMYLLKPKNVPNREGDRNACTSLKDPEEGGGLPGWNAGCDKRDQLPYKCLNPPPHPQ